MPFLRLTRDRRGFEHTFLLHADLPGETARVLYWYRTAPGVLIGRPALDEEAIRSIEEQHPEIEFDWPAILALARGHAAGGGCRAGPPGPRPPAGPREIAQGRQAANRSRRWSVELAPDEDAAVLSEPAPEAPVADHPRAARGTGRA